MNREKVIHKILQRFWGDESFSIRKLTGDAGTRDYYRVFHNGRTAVLMDQQKPYDSSADLFFRLTNYLSSLGFPVPKVLLDASEDGILLLDDLGDQMLQTIYQQNPDKTLKAYYSKVFRQLVRLHTICRKDTAGQYSDIFQQRFDYEKLRWELDFFMEHFVSRFKRLHLNPEQIAILDFHFDNLCQILEKEPIVFTHRDFHSRNIMIKDEEAYLIDYQDARMGPPEYDLASLLRDAYVKLPETYIEDFLENYYRETADKRDKSHRRYIFSLMCIQRNIKALGTFGFQASVRKNTTYLQYVSLLKQHLETELSYLEARNTRNDVFPNDLISFKRVLMHDILS